MQRKDDRRILRSNGTTAIAPFSLEPSPRNAGGSPSKGGGGLVLSRRKFRLLADLGEERQSASVFVMLGSPLRSQSSDIFRFETTFTQRRRSSSICASIRSKVERWLTPKPKVSNEARNSLSSSA